MERRAFYKKYGRTDSKSFHLFLRLAVAAAVLPHPLPIYFELQSKWKTRNKINQMSVVLLRFIIFKWNRFQHSLYKMVERVYKVGWGDLHYTSWLCVWLDIWRALGSWLELTDLSSNLLWGFVFVGEKKKWTTGDSFWRWGDNRIDRTCSTVFLDGRGGRKWLTWANVVLLTAECDLGDYKGVLKVQWNFVITLTLIIIE